MSANSHAIYVTRLTAAQSSVKNARSIPLASTIGFYLSFRLFFVLLAVRLFNQDPQVGVVTNLALNYLLLTVVAFHSFGPAPRKLSSMLHLPCYRWVFVFLSFSGISLLWSVTASLPAAAAFWSAMVADTAMVVLLLRTGPVDSVVSSLMRGYIWGTCAIALIAWVLPSQSDLRLGDEEFLGPNQIGWACAFAFFFAQYLMRTKDGNWLIQAVLLAVTLLRSLSKTTVIAFIAGEAYILLSDGTISRKLKLLFAASALLIAIIFSSLLANYYNVYVNAGNQAETLTGRLGIWAFILNEAVERPWLGHGFHSVWKIIPPFGEFEARHAHNELLQQFYAYGVTGVFMLVALYGSVYQQLRRLSDPSLKTFFFGMLLFIVVRGLADTEVFDLSLPMWFIAMIGALIEQSRIHCEVPA
jgi:exopolysaccharide production protein ExoQ